MLPKTPQWDNKEIKEGIRKYPKTNENGNSTLHNLWAATRISKREFNSDTGPSS